MVASARENYDFLRLLFSSGFEAPVRDWGKRYQVHTYNLIKAVMVPSGLCLQFYSNFSLLIVYLECTTSNTHYYNIRNPFQIQLRRHSSKNETICSIFTRHYFLFCCLHYCRKVSISFSVSLPSSFIDF